MQKKILSLFLICLLALGSLAGCGNSASLEGSGSKIPD